LHWFTLTVVVYPGSGDARNRFHDSNNQSLRR
jgi:hypothetical protein